MLTAAVKLCSCNSFFKKKNIKKMIWELNGVCLDCVSSTQIPTCIQRIFPL